MMCRAQEPPGPLTHPRARHRFALAHAIPLPPCSLRRKTRLFHRL
jgi:hypothetical protein